MTSLYAFNPIHIWRNKEASINICLVQGWNRRYPFNTGDLTISVNVLYNYLEVNPKVCMFVNFQLDSCSGLRSLNFKKIKSSLYSRYYAEACNELRDPSLHLAPGQHSSEETSQQWRVVGSTVFDLTDPGIVPKTSRIDSDVSNHYNKRPFSNSIEE